MNIQRHQVGFQGTVKFINHQRKEENIVDTSSIRLQKAGLFDTEHTKVFSSNQELGIYEGKSPEEVVKILGLKEPSQTINLRG